MAFTLQVAAADHPIKSVTVFKYSKAEIVRTFSLDLSAGQNKIEITGLPSSIDTQSVRVSGLGDARLFDVVCQLGDNKASQQDVNSFSEIIRVLQVKKDDLVANLGVRQNQAECLASYAKTLSGEHIKPSDMISFLESYVQLGEENREAISGISEEIVALDRQIETARTKQQAKKGEAHGEVTVVAVAQDSVKVDLKLTYLVANATWEPTYELHATTENGKPSPSVSLHYRARIVQSTGEDWNNTSLTLSTVASDGAKTIPRLLPLSIKQQENIFAQSMNNGIPRPAPQMQQMQQMQLQQMQQQVQMMQPQQQQMPAQQRQRQVPQAQQANFNAFGGFGSTGLFGGAPFAGLSSVASGSSGSAVLPSDSSLSATEDTFEEVVVPGPFSEPTTIVSETPLAISYSVEGKSTIPSDGIAHQVSVAMLTFEAEVTHVTIPRIDAQVYLQCEVKNTSEYRLLPGMVVVILDDSYVSKTSIQDVNKGDTFDCTLGADPSTRITYSRTAKKTRSPSGQFSEAFSTTTYTSLTKIHNKHHFAINGLVVHDAVPLAGDTRAKVLLRKPEKLADTNDGVNLEVKSGLKVRWGESVDGKLGQKEGRFDWVANIEAGQKVELVAEWDVKAPADSTWVETAFQEKLPFVMPL